MVPIGSVWSRLVQILFQTMMNKVNPDCSKCFNSKLFRSTAVKDLSLYLNCASMQRCAFLFFFQKVPHMFYFSKICVKKIETSMESSCLFGSVEGIPEVFISWIHRELFAPDVDCHGQPDLHGLPMQHQGNADEASFSETNRLH